MPTVTTPYQSQYIAWPLSRRMGAAAAANFQLAKAKAYGLRRALKEIFKVQWELA